MHTSPRALQSVVNWLCARARIQEKERRIKKAKEGVEKGEQKNAKGKEKDKDLMNRKKDGKPNVNGMKRENATETNANSDTQERFAKTTTRTTVN